MRVRGIICPKCGHEMAARSGVGGFSALCKNPVCTPVDAPILGSSIRWSPFTPKQARAVMKVKTAP